MVVDNANASVRMLGKGIDRPINTAQDRALLVASLRAVTAVVIFNEKTPLEVLRKFQPDIYVKGGDYDMKVLPETPLVRSWGGRSAEIPFRQGYSTTSLIQRISG